MTFNNIDLYCQVLGSMMKEPSVISSLPSEISIDDFSSDNKLARIIFYAVSNLIANGAAKIDEVTVETYLKGYPSFFSIYKKENGREFVAICLEKGQPENFQTFYSKLKKNALLKDLKDHGYDIAPFDVESAEPGTKEEFDKIVRYEEASEEDILAHVEKGFAAIRSRHTNGTTGYRHAGDYLDEILKDLEENPQQGPELCGPMFNSIVRGALRGKMYLRSGGTNVGKAIPNSTKIPMYDGTWKRVDEVKVGDLLIGSNGLPTKVLKVHPQPEPKEIYRIYFGDGHTAECCKDHLWQYNYKSHGMFKTKVASTEQMYDYGIKNGFKKKGYHFRIPLVKPVQYSPRNYSVPPYVMGLLLGDGSFRYDSTNKALSFSSSDEELVRTIANTMDYGYVKNSKYNYNWSFYHKNEDRQHKNVWVEEILKDYPELWDVKTEGKKIPEDYLIGSVEQRKDLLRGLLDTDGHFDKVSGGVSLTTINEILAKQVDRLARSLGYQCSIKRDKRIWKYTTGECFNVTIWCSWDEKKTLFRLNRKKSDVETYVSTHKKEQAKDYTGIKEIVKTGIYVDMTCFTVDAEDALFCMDNYTVTHNTRLAVFDACSIVYPIHFSSQNNSFIWIKDKVPQKVLFITTEMPEEEIQTIILAYVSGVEERKILRSACTPEEKERIRLAKKIIDKYNDYFLLERISDPNLNNVQTVIKKHVLLNDVGYVFYDYIFTSPSLITQFSSNKIRQDVALGLLSNQLKEIATTYNVFLMTGTQVNTDGLKVGEKRDQRVLRDAKSIADLLF